MLQLDFASIAANLPFLLEGLRLSLLVTVLSAGGGLVLGTVVALLRLLPGTMMSGAAASYVLLFRSIPLLLVLFWFFFLVPLVLRRPIDGLYCALIAFILFESAYFSEIVRAGILSIPVGQRNAAYAVGLRVYQVFGYIVLPQAFRNILPVLITQTVVLFQDTSILYIVSLHDFMTNASIVANRDGRLVEMYLFAAAVYLVLCSIASQVARTLFRTRGV